VNAGGSYELNEEDNWTDPWVARVVGVTVSSSDKTTRLWDVMQNLYIHEYVVKNSSENGCRKVRVDNFRWYNTEGTVNSVLELNSTLNWGVYPLNINFEIKFISQDDNTEKIKAYNEAVKVEKLLEP